MLLVRRIGRRKWPATFTDGSADRIPADAVTADLRTQNNSLSFWICEDVDDLEGAVLAIAAAAQRITPIDIVWIEDHELQFSEYRRVRTDGDTPVAAWRQRHLDLGGLDYAGLGNVASVVADAVSANRWRRVPLPRVREMLAKSVSEDALRLDDLEPKVQSEIRTALDKRTERPYPGP